MSWACSGPGIWDQGSGLPRVTLGRPRRSLGAPWAFLSLILGFGVLRPVLRLLSLWAQEPQRPRQALKKDLKAV